MAKQRIGPLQRAILHCAASGREVRVAALARELCTTEPAVSRALRKLERKGLLRPPLGWRVTAAGRAAVESAPQH